MLLLLFRRPGILVVAIFFALVSLCNATVLESKCAQRVRPVQVRKASEVAVR